MLSITDYNVNEIYSKSSPAKKLIPEVRPANKEEKIPKNRGSICITSSAMTGYVGEDFSKQALRPDYLNKITLEDGSPLPLIPEDQFLELHVFEPTSQLKKLNFPSSLFLPKSIFSSKKDGDLLRLQYEGRPVEFTIKQNDHQLKFEQGSFQDVLKNAESYVKTTDIEEPLFSKYKNTPYDYYSLLKQGAIYKVRGEKNPAGFGHLESEEDFKLRLLENPKVTPLDVIKTKENVMIVVSFSGFEFADIDVILNDHYIVFYGHFKDRESTILIEDPIRTFSFKNSKEFIARLRWDRSPTLSKFSLVELKAKIKTTSVSLINGLLQLAIPLD